MKCNFCGDAVERGTGKLLVKKTGKIFGFCSRRCEKNLTKLNRVPRTTRWTKYYVKAGSDKGVPSD